MSLDPRYTPRRPWAPLSDAELALLRPYFVHGGVGRPMHDLRGRLDAIFWAVTHNGFWKDLPAEMGPWDTAHRQFRRWAHKGVWTALLKAVADPACPPGLRRLEHWICRAYRRALRVLKLAGIVLARRLGLLSALNGPPWMLPDPDLSDMFIPRILAAIERCMANGRLPDIALLRAGQAIHRLAGGRRYIPRCLAPA